MATVEVTLTGDVADIVDQDFSQAWVKLVANTEFIADPDADKIRVLSQDYREVNADGTFTFTDVIASVDTIVAGTLQYHVVVRARTQRTLTSVSLGPYSLAGLTGTLDVTDLEATQPTGAVRQAITDADLDILAEALAYTDTELDDHISAANPHPVYAQLVNTSGSPTGGQIILAGAGEPFPPVEVGSILIYGGA